MPSQTINLNAALFVEGQVCTLYYVNKNPSIVSFCARYTTSYYDLDSINFKHIKFVDFIGDYGNNETTLKWDKTGVYGNWSALSSQADNYVENAYRWYNLGHARRVAFCVDWAGDENLTHKAIEVSYSIRTQ